MSKGIFVTATGTDIGKTYVTALLVKQLRELNMNAGYYKAALSGAEETPEGLMPGDAAYVNEIAKLGEKPENLVSYIYKNAVSPHLAAKIEGNPLEMSVVERDYKELSKKYDYMVVEGSGGIVCPIRYDEKEHIFLEDIIKALELSVILVADAGLGTLNSIVLTCEYLKQKQFPLRGIILNNYDPDNPMHQDNQEMIKDLLKTPILALVEADATDLMADSAALESLFNSVN